MFQRITRREDLRERALRGLMVAVVAMGVLIVAGVAVIGATIVSRMAGSHHAGGSMADLVLEEPPGTHIAGIAGVADHLAVLLAGGGPDRVVVLDPATGRRLAGLRLASPLH